MSFLKTLDYPGSRSFKIVLALISSFFIYLFLIFFQPFGVNNYNPSEVVTLELAWGIFPIVPTIFLILIFNEFILRPMLKIKGNKVRSILWILYVFISVGSGSFLLYNYLGEFHDFSFSSYTRHILEVSTVFIFPFLGTILFFSYSKVARDYSEILSVSNQQIGQNETLFIKGDYKNDQIALPKNSIICLTSEDNYVGLQYLEDGITKKYLIRSTLSKMEAVLSSRDFVRCNRSKIVNLHHLEALKKDGKGLFLKFKHLDSEIQVSKSKAQKVLDLAKAYISTLS